MSESALSSAIDGVDVDGSDVDRVDIDGLDGDGVAELADVLRYGRVVILSGAGLSTESGIPDYRGPSGALRRHAPMTYHAFVHDPVARHRYWARSYVGWRQIADARPNDGHRAVAHLQALGVIDGIITQNVDGLHQAGGAKDVLELHGGLDRTVCLNCGDLASRVGVEERLHEANPDFVVPTSEINPDGDADLPEEHLASFVMVPCQVCGLGPLKPDVVFFGETVPRERVEHAFALVQAASALLVLGSSLKVMSGYRFVVRAAKLGVPVVIVNQGPTRGDQSANLKIDAPLGALLRATSARL